jgi:hypothetical protein
LSSGGAAPLAAAAEVIVVIVFDAVPFQGLIAAAISDLSGSSHAPAANCIQTHIPVK